MSVNRNRLEVQSMINITSIPKATSMATGETTRRCYQCLSNMAAAGMIQNSWQMLIKLYSRSRSSCTRHAYSEVCVGDNELTAVCRVPVTAIRIHSESLTAAKPVKHSVVKQVRVFDMHTSHLIFGLVLSDIIDVAGSTSPERGSNICCVVYHLIEQY
jgi:hypothetical protein